MLVHATRNTRIGFALALTAILTGAAAPAINKAIKRDAARTVHGDAVTLGNGTVRAYITMNGNEPVELGVAISKAAMQSLPAGTHADPPVPGVSFFPNLLPLPKDNPTPFKLVELDWNPMGHEPEHVYTVPHFDFHFYTIGREQWDAMTPADPAFQDKGMRKPAAEFVPEGYLAPVPLVVPKMGLHWISGQAGELAGKPFTTTFLYGSYDGRFIFAEPMITKAFIENTTDFTADVPMAKQYQVAGYHPSKYSVRFDEAAQEYRIALTGFVKK